MEVIVLETVFYCLAVIGIYVISFLAFIIPEDPYKIIPAMTYTSVDKPLWLCIIVVGSVFYLLFLYLIYEFLTKKILN